MSHKVKFNTTPDPLVAKFTTQGVGIVNASINEDGDLIIVLSSGKEENLGKVRGDNGVTFVPSISVDKILSWTNDGELVNPDPIDLETNVEWGDMPNEEL